MYREFIGKYDTPGPMGPGPGPPRAQAARSLCGGPGPMGPGPWAHGPRCVVFPYKFFIYSIYIPYTFLIYSLCLLSE